MRCQAPRGVPARAALKSVLAATAVYAIAGCGALDWIVGNNIDINGAHPVIGQERADVGNSKVGYVLFGQENHFDRVDVVPLLTGGEQCQSPNLPLTSYPLFGSSPDAQDQRPECIEWAFDCFYNYKAGQCPALNNRGAALESPPNQGRLTLQASAVAPPDSDLEYLKMRRNAVQERLIAASNSACRAFTQHLNTYQSYTNLVLGTAAVGTGAAGGIVSNTVAARTLAGVTGAISGARAEYNSDIFAQKLVATIVQAIDESRREWLLALRGSLVEEGTPALPKASPSASPSPAASASPAATPAVLSTAPVQGRQARSITEYTVEAAIADALYYNDLCSLDKGLQTLTQSLTAATDPGLDQVKLDIQKYYAIGDLIRQGSIAPPKPTDHAPPPADGH